MSRKTSKCVRFGLKFELLRTSAQDVCVGGDIFFNNNGVHPLVVRDTTQEEQRVDDKPVKKAANAVSTASNTFSWIYHLKCLRSIPFILPQILGTKSEIAIVRHRYTLVH